MAMNSKDLEIAQQVANEFILNLQDPLKVENLRFIKKFTTRPDDPGFKIFYNNVKKINALLGQDEAEQKITSLIAKIEVTPFVETENPDWNSVETNIMAKYPEFGEEIILQCKVFDAVNKGKWNVLPNVLRSWFQKYGFKRKWIGINIINAIAWRTFENLNDIASLESALVMTSNAIKTEEDANLFDTHANLLYKLGRKDEAIAWEEKAVKLSKNQLEKVATLEKMKANIPTWISATTTVFFNKENNLVSVLRKAKTERRYIMFDFMATWCGPCKEMDKSVYTNKQVGEVLNANFVSVKIQTDKTERDSEYIKSWRKDIPALMKKYDVTGLPTLIFLTPEGKVVKKVVGGVDAAGLIKVAEEVLEIKVL